MTEITIDSPRKPAPGLPDDVQVFGDVASYRVSYSQSQGGVFITTTSYHPGILFLTQEDLRKLLGNL